MNINEINELKEAIEAIDPNKKTFDKKILSI